jgi:hypothetical protein
MNSTVGGRLYKSKPIPNQLFGIVTPEAARTLGARQPLSWSCVSAIDSNARTIWIADAHRGDGKRYIVRADEKLTAFIELESAIFRQPSRGWGASA